MTDIDAGSSPLGEKGTLAPCPNCGASWQLTELMSEAHRGGGYHVLCHICHHEWDDVHASHSARETATRQAARTLLARQDEAYGPPRGSWWQRLIPGLCRHKNVRCTHGDEIRGRGGSRRMCLDCGRSLNGPLPDECFFTGQPHLSASGRSPKSKEPHRGS